MFQRFHRVLALAALLFGGALIAFLVMDVAPRPASGAPAMSPTIRHTVLNVSCTSAAAFGSAYTKITDIGDFTAASADSVVEVTYHGRVNVDTLTGTTGTVFELRVDDQPSPVGRARAHINTVGISGEHVSFTGIFPNLTAGEHTVSIWVRTSTGNSGTGGRVDPGCWSSDVVIVREYTAFGSVFLPIMTEE
jgi:hypothetical protein